MALTNLKAPIPKNLIDLLANALNSITSLVWGNITGTLSDQTDLQNALNAKQNTLVSGTNIKTLNGNSLLGSGNLSTPAAGSTGEIQFNTSNSLASDTNLFWDNANNYLGVGTNTGLNANVTIKGYGTGNTANVSVTNSAGGKIIRSTNNGYVFIGNNSSDGVFIGSSFQTNEVPTTTETGQNNLVFSTALGNVAGHGFIFTNPTFTFSPPSGTTNVITFGDIEFVANSGTGNFTAYNINPVINQTLTATGIVRGVLYKPSITSITGEHRAIETTEGDVLFGTTSGTVKIGTTASPQTQFKSTGEFGFGGATPTSPQTGWGVANPVTNRALDVSTATLGQVTQVLGTLIDDLKAKGIIKT